jgi:hypothetical protein
VNVTNTYGMRGSFKSAAVRDEFSRGLINSAKMGITQRYLSVIMPNCHVPFVLNKSEQVQ